MSDLRICKAMSLHPSANIAGSLAEFSTGSGSGNSSRICLMGCEATASELRRFPVHDINRCNYWLRHFGVSNELVKELGGLKKLRICFRHFSQRQREMAKTRIKTTPLRGSKHNDITTTPTAAATTTTTTSAATATTTTTSGKPMADSTTIELVDSSSGDFQKQLPPQIKGKSVTTITPVPQRSHSICSSSSVSSDVQSISSDYEASMPLSALVDAQVQNAVPKSPNGLNKKRKLYLITEKSDDKNGNSATNGQKRKMFVVVEQEKDTAAKKLMIVTDKSKANLTQHLEKFLPEILSCIQDKEQKAKHKAIKHPAIKLEPSPTPVIHKPHITLPPKKNPTNFVKLEGAPTISLPASVSILPVEPVKDPSPPETETETNINLSPDFRFLMKILPKLEQLPEPHKQHVKRSIQIFVEESYSHYGKKD